MIESLRLESYLPTLKHFIYQFKTGDLRIWDFQNKDIYPWIVSAMYFLIIFSMKLFIPVRKDGPKYKYLSFFHNLSMCLISLYNLYGTIKTSVWRVVYTGDLTFFQLYCNQDQHYIAPDSEYVWWINYYLFSKALEMGDTFLTVLRGRRQTALALFHHSIMVHVAYWCVKTGTSLSFIAGGLNCIVHVVMYLYYALHTMGLNVAFIRKNITRFQILQFFIILVGNLPYIFFIKKLGIPCGGEWGITAWCWMEIPVFLILLFFLNFYIVNYIRNKREQNKKKN